MSAPLKSSAAFTRKLTATLTPSGPTPSSIQPKPITYADLPNDRGADYCGKLGTHDYRLYLAINDIKPTKSHIVTRICVTYNSKVKIKTNGHFDVITEKQPFDSMPLATYFKNIARTEINNKSHRTSANCVRPN